MSTRFCDLESPVDPEYLETDSSLTSWYKGVRKIPIEEMGIGDICRAIRQELYLHHVLPVAFRVATEDVTAGELYEGELIAALAGLPNKVLRSVPSTEGLLKALKETALLAGIGDDAGSSDCAKLAHSLRAP